MAAGSTQDSAAAIVGIAPRTARRWYSEPLVKAELAALTDASLSATARRLNDGASGMLDILQAIASDPKTPSSVRLRSAAVWLDILFRAREMVELTMRISELEKQVNYGLGSKD